MSPLSNNKHYRDFMHKRDEALESILDNFRRKQTEILNLLFIRLLQVVEMQFSRLNSVPKKIVIDDIERQFYLAGDIASRELSDEIYKFRMKVYLLSHDAEAYATATRTGKKVPELHDFEVKKFQHGKLNDQFAVKDRCDYDVTNIVMKARQALTLGVLMDEDVKKVMGRVFKSFPRVVEMPKKPALKKVKAYEADVPALSFSLKRPGADNSIKKEYTPFFTDELWNEIIKDYEEEYVPNWRDPLHYFNLTDPSSDEAIIAKSIGSTDQIYAWELERVMTHDFVVGVRQGSIKAANEMGIDEFIWIAILDDRTCEDCCGDYGCADFDGKLTSEIEKMTKGEHSVPPAHINCRCTLSPVSKDELEFVNTTDSEKDFDEWLRT